jgi:signal transduction histidine kinase
MAHRAEPVATAETYATMLAQARRMKMLIDNLITLARLEHPNGSAAQTVDLNRICADLPANFDEGAQQRIHVRLSGTPAYVEGNETDIAGALCALVDNALKYAPGSPVEVRVTADGAHWTVYVADRGPGMSAADLSNAYDRFYRGCTSEGTDGTGLGLPIVRKSIERAGGSVLLCNREGGGLLCTVRLLAGLAPRSGVTTRAGFTFHRESI